MEAIKRFAGDRIEALSKPETYETIALSKVHPLLGLADGLSKMTGGPGVRKGFQEGVIQETGDPRSGQYDIVLPPMPY